MNSSIKQSFPPQYDNINQATKVAGFSMASDVLTGSLLRTLAAAKPAGKLLELGTGTGLSTSWILDGMDARSSLISIDNTAKFIDIAKQYLGNDSRLLLESIDGEAWIRAREGEKFDYIFADTWHGKYLMLEEVLAMLNAGGFYIIDDMIPQPNWPEGHAQKAMKLMDELEKREDLALTKLTWSTGIIIGVKK